MPHFMIVLIPYIGLLNLDIFEEYGDFNLNCFIIIIIIICCFFFNQYNKTI